MDREVWYWAKVEVSVVGTRIPRDGVETIAGVDD
jgi:hypothetical protein